MTKHERIDFNDKTNVNDKNQTKKNLSLLDACIWNGATPRSFEIILQQCCCIDWKDKGLNKYHLYPSVTLSLTVFVFFNVLFKAICFVLFFLFMF